MLARLLALLAFASAADLTLVTFDDDPATGERSWADMNDPVMGGKSSSSFSTKGNLGIFSGYVAIVPFLKAPGFCKVATQRGWFQPSRIANASKYIDGALYITARSTTPNYKGFKVAFTAKNTTRPHSGGVHHAGPSFKAGFAVPAGDDFATIRVPFSDFSVDWSEFTGRCDTRDPTGVQHVCCSADHPEVCPMAHHLANLLSFEIWAEGVEGKFGISLKRIAAGP